MILLVSVLSNSYQTCQIGMLGVSLDSISIKLIDKMCV
nr:MAG TPA: hypothetical protein [Caudoviricetes sp.]